MILSSVILRLPPPLITPPAPSQPEPAELGGQPIGARLWLWLRNGPKHYLILSWKLNCPERKIRWLVCSVKMKAAGLEWGDNRSSGAERIILMTISLSNISSRITLS